MPIPYSSSVDSFTADQVNVRMEGLSCTVAASGVSNNDFQFAETRLINEGSLLINGGKQGDTIGLQVVDKDNVLGYGVGAVLNTFAKDLGVNPGQVFQMHYKIPYVAKLYNFLYVRIVYSATDADTRYVTLNLISHIPI